MTNQDYHNDPSQWGDSQYISLKDIVDEYMNGVSPDDPTYNVGRSTIRRKARNAIKMYNFSTVREITSLEIDLSSSLTITLPLDYSDYYRISWVDPDGKIYPMAKNDRLSVAKGILQDHNFKFIYDHEGEFLKATGTSPSVNSIVNHTSNINTDRGQAFINGDFNIDKEAGIIRFGSSAKEKVVVLEYISDGLFNKDDSKVKINAMAFEAVNDRIYFKLIERNRQVPQSEKDRARRAWKVSDSLLTSMLNPVRLEDVLQVEKSKTRQVKQV